MQLKEANIELNLYKSAAKDGNSLLEIKLKSQVDSMTKDRCLLQEEIKVSIQLHSTKKFEAMR